MEERGLSDNDLRDLTEELLIEPDLIFTKKWFD